ncbi:hypothetical protein IKG45_01245 [Candidatus Saccharibacteria bacterium]|nr:hypothetical protein [Candidatus Saccharibacteria bacterium]
MTPEEISKTFVDDLKLEMAGRDGSYIRIERKNVDISKANAEADGTNPSHSKPADKHLQEEPNSGWDPIQFAVEYALGRAE